MELQTISASRIKTYKTCAKQYYYKYIVEKENRPEQDKNIGALLGTSLHKAIELYYKDKSPAIKTFQTTMTETYDQWNDNNHTIRGEEWFSKSMKLGKTILNEFDWDFWQPKELELNFTLPFPTKYKSIVHINGIIDIIDTREWIVDHKSQRKTPTQDEMDNDPQFILYAWAYKELYGNLPAKIYWNELRTGRKIEVHSLRDFNMKLTQLTTDIEAMLENKKYARRQMDRVCKTECSFYSLCFGEKHEDIKEKDVDD